MSLIRTTTLVFALACLSLTASAHGKMDAACDADKAKFCADKNGKDLHKCMMAHEADLSDACKAAHAKHGKMHGKKHDATDAAPATDAPKQ